MKVLMFKWVSTNHSYFLSKMFMVKHRIVQVQHHSYQTFRALCDFFVFLKLKIHFKAKIWRSEH